MFSAKINIVEQIATALQGFDDSVGVGAPIEHLPRRNHMSEETFTPIPLVGYKFLTEIENISYSRLVRAAYVKKEFVGWISKKDAISKLSFLKKTAIYKIFNKLEELGLLEQKEKSYKVYILSSTAKRENNKWVDTRVYLDDCNYSYKEYPSITTFESYKEVINEWTTKFSDKKIKNNKIEQVCGFTKLTDKILYNTEIDLQNKIDWLRMRRIKDLEINTSKSEKPFVPNWNAIGTILGMNGRKLRQQITSTICATKDKKGFIVNYTSSNNGFSFDVTDELVYSDYNKRTDNQKKISDEEVEELMKDIPSAEEELLEMISEEKESIIEEKKESIIEEEIDENNTDDSTIKQLLDALDCAAKPLSDSQAYIGCIVFNVKDRLQEMKNMKGEGYAINYMKNHWPKIDLCKVLY